MKSILIRTGIAVVMALVAMNLWGQDGKKLDVDIDVNKSDSNWYQQPWVWVVGVAVFVLLLVAILRGGSKREA